MKFDEISEIYTSMTLRSFGFSIIGVFVPVYLYQQGVDINSILWFYVAFFSIRIPFAYIAGKYIGKIGPKHAIAVSNVLTIAFLLMLLSYSRYDWNLLGLATIFTMANGLFFIAYHADFSSIQHKKHGGKELGWLFIFERAGAAAGPFIGGLTATLISPEFTIGMALVILMISLIPLFMTAEPIKTHMKIDYSKVPRRVIKEDAIPMGAMNVIWMATAVFWPLYIAVYIFDQDVYATLGSIISISILISMISAHLSGKFIDDKKARPLLKFSIFVGMIVAAGRSIITATSGAVVVSAFDQPNMVVNRMVMTKAYYDRAESMKDNRIAYLAVMEMFVSVVKVFAALFVLICATIFDPQTAFRICFVVLGAMGVFMLNNTFPLLKKGSKK